LIEIEKKLNKFLNDNIEILKTASLSEPNKNSTQLEKSQKVVIDSVYSEIIICLKVYNYILNSEIEKLNYKLLALLLDLIKYNEDPEVM